MDRITDLKEVNDKTIFSLNKKLIDTTKYLNDLKEYVEIGVLFSNLDIKHCPSCNHKVSQHRKTINTNEHKCSLCHEKVDKETTDIDIEVYRKKIESQSIIIRDIKVELDKLKTNEKDLQSTYNRKYEERIKLEQIESIAKGSNSFSERLQELNEIIHSTQNKSVPNYEKKEKLISKKAVIQFQIDQILNIKPKSKIDYDTKIQFLNVAIKKLSEERFALGSRIINRLSTLMLDEIQSLGLTSITEVIIDEKFDIQYRQDNDLIRFDNIAEGEQLRVKIAFYLSLIQLDIEFNFGRHSRLLIIDSPSKEEADNKYLDGLSEILGGIERRYGDNLQILIGTAERKLSGIVEHQTEFPLNEYVF